MLLLLHEELVRKFHIEFISLYKPEKDDFLEIERKITMIKKKIKIEKLEFYLSTFFHHLTLSTDKFILEIYDKEIINDKEQRKKTLIKYINQDYKECLKLENYDFKLLF